MGPSVSAGKNVSAPTRNTTPIKRITKRGPVTGNDPGPCGTSFFRASDHASAITGITIRNLPKNIARPSVVSYHIAFAVSPANALPLFPVAELNA